MEITQLPGSDLDTLPFYITASQSGRTVPVRFAPLAPEDADELTSELWRQAVFSDVWPQFIGDETTRKLVCTQNEDLRIQGLVRFGSVTRSGGLLKHNLLEAAPFNQHNTSVQQYRGVGRVLVARLVAESVAQGGEGRVAVSPRRGTEPFYLAIGFKMKNIMRLDSAAAETLLEATLLHQRKFGGEME